MDNQKPSITTTDIVRANDAFMCYLDYLEKAGIDKKNPELYNGIVHSMSNFKRFNQWLQRTESGSITTLIKE